MRILVVDVEGDLIDKVYAELEQSYIVDVAHDSVEGGMLSEANDYDAVIAGPDVCTEESGDFYTRARLLNKRLPIAAVSQNDSVDEHINALRLGADVCISRTQNPKEVDAQLKAMIRRNSYCADEVIRTGKIILERFLRRVLINGKEVEFRRKEYDLLEYLLANKGRLVSKESILEHLWDGSIYILSNTVEVHMRNLRNKLKKFGVKNLIRTRRGFGYFIQG